MKVVSKDPDANEGAISRSNGLQIAEDAEFEAGTSRLRRITWWLLAGVLAAGLAGSFGWGTSGTILRAAILYLFLLLVFRLAGNRIMGKITTFDFVLLLVISEATGQVLVAEEPSLAAAFTAILTLIGLDIGFALLKERWRRLDRWFEGTALILVENGRPLRERMRREQIDDDDILASARERHGLERMDQIRYAVLERSGGISIVPEPTPSSGAWRNGRSVSSPSRRSRRKPSTH